MNLTNCDRFLSLLVIPSYSAPSFLFKYRIKEPEELTASYSHQHCEELVGKSSYFLSIIWLECRLLYFTVYLKHISTAATFDDKVIQYKKCEQLKYIALNDILLFFFFHSYHLLLNFSTLYVQCIHCW